VNDALSCPHCSAPLGAGEVLDAATVSLPAAAVVSLLCPRCGHEAWARIGDGQLSMGAPVDDVALFRPAVVAAAPSLAFRPDASWLDCWYDGRYRRFPAARAPLGRSPGA
jgi:hypothetical protein